MRFVERVFVATLQGRRTLENVEHASYIVATVFLLLHVWSRNFLLFGQDFLTPQTPCDACGRVFVDAVTDSGGVSDGHDDCPVDGGGTRTAGRPALSRGLM
jgi:hypothetical protein